MVKLISNKVIASALENRNAKFFFEHSEQFLRRNINLVPTLHYEALHLTSLLYLDINNYKKAFQFAFFLKEIAGNTTKSRQLIIDVVYEFAKNEKEYLSKEDVKLLVNEIKIQYSYLKIQGFNEKMIKKYNALMYYLKSIEEKTDLKNKEGKHQLLFTYLSDLFLRSNSSSEAWDRAALIIIGMYIS